MKIKKIISIFALIVFGFAASAQHPLPSHSYLEIFDIETGEHTVIKEFPFVIEAPN